MNIEATKLELMHLLQQTQKEFLLKKIKDVFEEEQVDWFDEISEEEQEEIKIGLAQADKGGFVENDAVMKRFD